MGTASAVKKILNERLMILLSLVTLPGAALEVLAEIQPPWALIVDVIDWSVVSAFVLEYSAKLKLAPSKRRFVLDRWNLLNLLIMLLALAGFATASPILYSAPLLRIVRATKLLTESGRSSAELGR